MTTTLMVFVGLIVSGFITLVVYSAYIIVIAFTIWMAVDAGKQDRFWWIVLIIGVPVIGSAAYYLTEKKHEYVKAEPHHIHTGETETQHEQAPKKKVSRKKADHKEEAVVVAEGVVSESTTDSAIVPIDTETTETKS